MDIPQLADTCSLNPLDIENRVKELKTKMSKIETIINI